MRMQKDRPMGNHSIAEPSLYYGGNLLLNL